MKVELKEHEWTTVATTMMTFGKFLIDHKVDPEKGDLIRDIGAKVMMQILEEKEDAEG